MSLMLKLLSATVVSSVALFAGADADLQKMLEQQIGRNPNVKELKVTVIQKTPIKQAKGWDGLIVELKGKANTQNGIVPFNEKNIYFVNGGVMAPDLVDLKTGRSIKSQVTPKMKTAYYDDAHRVYGNKNAKHTITIFSDPLCPYCQKSVPEALDYVKKYPKTFAVYYYHLPLESIHPASITLVKAMNVLQKDGKKDFIQKAYKTSIEASEQDSKKILEAFNKAVGTKVTLKDIDSKTVLSHYKHDLDVASSLMVRGTPTIFIDGSKDNSRNGYKNIKIVD